MAGGIPKYHSYLDYYRPPKKAPAADIWGEINRGAQGILGGYMKYQQEQESNNLQNAIADSYKSINNDTSQEEAMKIFTDISGKYKLNKQSKARYELAISRMVRYLPTQKQKEEYDLKQQGITEQKELSKNKRIESELSKNIVSQIKNGANQHLIETGISLDIKTNIDNRLSYAKNFIEGLNEADLTKAGIPKENILAFKNKLSSVCSDSFAGESDIRTVIRQRDRNIKRSETERDKLKKQLEMEKEKKVKKTNIYAGKTQKEFTNVGKDMVILQSFPPESDNAKKTSRNAITDLYLLAYNAKDMNDIKTLGNVANTYNQIVKQMTEGNNYVMRENKELIKNLRTRNWKEDIGNIIGYKPNENLKGNMLDPTFIVDPELKVPNDITLGNIEALKKGLGKAKMKQIYRAFAPYINRTTETNRLFTDIFIFNYITQYGEF